MVPSLNSLTPIGQSSDTRAEPTLEQRKVAQQFESIFIRQMLKGLEKSVSHGPSSGGGVYRSLVVGAVADSASSGGGIGLSEVILKAMLPPVPVEVSQHATPADEAPEKLGPRSQSVAHDTGGRPAST